MAASSSEPAATPPLPNKLLGGPAVKLGPRILVEGGHEPYEVYETNFKRLNKDQMRLLKMMEKVRGAQRTKRSPGGFTAVPNGKGGSALVFKPA